MAGVPTSTKAVATITVEPYHGGTGFYKEREGGGCERCRSSNWGVLQQLPGGVAAVKGGVALDRPIYIYIYIFFSFIFYIY